MHLATIFLQLVAKRRPNDFFQLPALYPEENCLERLTLEAPILKLSWQPGHIYVTLYGPKQIKWQGEKPATDLHPSHGQ